MSDPVVNLGERNKIQEKDKSKKIGWKIESEDYK